MKRDQSQIIDDRSLMQSDPICSSAGCVVKQKATHPMDYFVPNFGLDQDIIDSQAHEAQSQKVLKHNWNWSSAPTRAEIEDKKLIRWGDYDTQGSLVQKGSSSDPICSSAFHPDCIGWGRKDKSEEPVQYPVTHGYPLDGDIIDSQKHLADQEKSKKHVLNINPPRKSLIQREI